MMDATLAIPSEWYFGCQALRETLAGRLDNQTTVAARHLVWSLLQRLRRNHSLAELRVEYATARRESTRVTESPRRGSPRVDSVCRPPVGCEEYR